MRVTTSDESAETHRLNIEDIAPMGEELLKEELRLVIGGLTDTSTATGCLGVWDPIELF
ncbi:MAG: hypothetical protein M3Q03_08260 [Chloroflexota bacterium]|nr:hypothetical protein [Chloroflexota bacterium]